MGRVLSTLISTRLDSTAKKGTFKMRRVLRSSACIAGDHPPTDEEGFMGYVRSLPTPDIHEALQGAEALSPIQAYSGAGNLRHEYDQVSVEGQKRMPRGYLSWHATSMKVSQH
jgi:hypothetical protein